MSVYETDKYPFLAQECGLICRTGPAKSPSTRCLVRSPVACEIARGNGIARAHNGNWFWICSVDCGREAGSGPGTGRESRNSQAGSTFAACSKFQYLFQGAALSDGLTQDLARDPWKIGIFTSNIAYCPSANEVCESTRWHVSSGLLQTLPVARMKLATIHLRSVESVTVDGSPDHVVALALEVVTLCLYFSSPPDSLAQRARFSGMSHCERTASRKPNRFPQAGPIEVAHFGHSFENFEKTPALMTEIAKAYAATGRAGTSSSTGLQ